MDFDFDKDLIIFNSFFQKRPEVSKEELKKNLKDYYIPFIQKLINLKKEKNSPDSLVVGISAIQGAGKTTQGEILEILLDHFKSSSISLSVDDHYLTHNELNELRAKDPRYIKRGVTHDINLAIQNLTDLKNMEEKALLVSGYDKGAKGGDGDRFRWVNMKAGVILRGEIVNQKLHINSIFYRNEPIEVPEDMGSDLELDELRDLTGEVTIFDKEDSVLFSADKEILIKKKDLPKGWRVVAEKPDFIFYDGWMLGARRVADESVFESNLPALDSPEHIKFAKDINKKLDEYLPLWDLIDFMNVLYVEDYKVSLIWRDQAEEVLRKKGGGMNKEEIKEFVYYFWRSVHPAIQIKNLAMDLEHTQQVVVIKNDHTISRILTPVELKTHG